MISDQYAINQIGRLAAIHRSKRLTKGEIHEYLRVTKAAAKTDHQVGAAITAWLDTQTFPPSPAELRVMIEATPTHSAKPTGDCLDCSGTGRRSFWALVTIERWQDSGRIRRRNVEEIPVEGDPNLWLVNTPALAAEVDGNEQRVVMMSGYCHCDAGKRMAQMVQARLEL
jgi:hypothetical protein